MGRRLDGVSPHMLEHRKDRSFQPSDDPEPDRSAVVGALQSTGTHVLVNYLPVGSEEATRFYAECALEAGVAFVNCIPVFIASDPAFAERFREAGVPIVGDDIKAQVTAANKARSS